MHGLLIPNQTHSMGFQWQWHWMPIDAMLWENQSVGWAVPRIPNWGHNAVASCWPICVFFPHYHSNRNKNADCWSWYILVRVAFHWEEGRTRWCMRKYSSSLVCKLDSNHVHRAVDSYVDYSWDGHHDFLISGAIMFSWMCSHILFFVASWRSPSVGELI